MEALKSYNRMTDKMEPIEQAMLYYNVLTRGGGYGYSFFCHLKNFIPMNRDTSEETGKASRHYGQYCVKNEEAYKEQYSHHYEDYNCYTTLNLFSGEYRYHPKKYKRGFFREEQDATYINGLLIDFDIMKGSGVKESYTIEEGEKYIEQVLDTISRLCNEEKMVKPTLITRSGRGVQMLVLYRNPLSVKDDIAMFKHKRLYQTVTTSLQGLFDKDYVEVDASVKDYSRICRVPGTKHQKNGVYAELQEYNDRCYYDLDDLCDVFKVNLEPEEKKVKKNEQVKLVSSVKRTKRTNYVLNPKKAVIAPYTVFNEKLVERRNVKGKINAIERLVAYRGMAEGQYRELTLHIYYSLQRKVLPADRAKDRTIDLNEQFAEPLSESVVNALVRNADEHEGKAVGDIYNIHCFPSGYYEYSRETIVNVLNMSEEEIVYTGIEKRKREKERAEKNNEARMDALALIISMLKNGERESAIVAVCMEKYGKSKATIYRWIAKAKNEDVICEVEERERKKQEQKAQEQKAEEEKIYREKMRETKMKEENERRKVEDEVLLSHFGVNRKGEYYEEDAKGAKIFENLAIDARKHRKEDKYGASEESQYLDGVFRYRYARAELQQPNSIDVTEYYIIEASPHYAMRIVYTRYKDGEILSKDDKGWHIDGRPLLCAAV